MDFAGNNFLDVLAEVMVECQTLNKTSGCVKEEAERLSEADDW